jgi:hypothetical protein
MSDELPDSEEDGGETVVVHRTPAVDEGTVVIDRSPAVEEGTVVIDRSAPEEGTVVIDRSLAVEEGTVVIDRSAPEEGTVVIDRRRDSGRRTPRSGASVLGTLPQRGRRRALTPAPGGEAVNKAAVLASGPGAVTTYSPRAIPSPPAPSVNPDTGQSATRAAAPSLPSVARRSTRWSRTALAAFAIACLISLIGLVLMVVILTAG